MKFSIPKFSKVASAGSLAAVVATSVQQNQSAPVEQYIPAAESIFEGPQIWLSSKESFETADVVVMNSLSVIDGWDGATQKRYSELAVREALETITPSEERELKNLETARERTLAPPSYEEIVRSVEAKRRTEDLISALSRYVTLYDPNFSPGGAKRKAAAATKAS